MTDELAADLSDFVLKLIHSSAEGQIYSFPVSSAGAPGTDFGYVSLRLVEVVAWHLDGLVNAGAAAALWAEMGGPSESE